MRHQGSHWYLTSSAILDQKDSLIHWSSVCLQVAEAILHSSSARGAAFGGKQIVTPLFPQPLAVSTGEFADPVPTITWGCLGESPDPSCEVPYSYIPSPLSARDVGGPLLSRKVCMGTPGPREQPQILTTSGTLLQELPLTPGITELARLRWDSSCCTGDGDPLVRIRAGRGWRRFRSSTRSRRIFLAG